MYSPVSKAAVGEQAVPPQPSDSCQSRAVRNYAAGLIVLHRYAEAKSWLRKQIPMASRVMGNSNAGTLIMKKMYAMALYKGPSATFDDLRESVATLEDIERIARRVFGGAHPLTRRIERDLRDARAALHARETQA